MLKRLRFLDFFQFFAYLVLGLGSFYFWIEVVVPLPDRDSLHQLYYPFLNSLIAGHEISANPLFLKALLQEAYPWGLALISSLFSFTGISPWISQHPWMFPTLFSIPTFLIPFVLTRDWTMRFFIFTGIWFFPTTQIALKTFSFHGLIAMLALPALVFFWHGLEKGNGKSLLIASLLIGYGATLKHFGAFIAINLIFVLLLWKLLRRDSLSSFLITTFLCTLLVLLFYPLEGIKVYSAVALSHNLQLSPLPILLTVFVGVVLILGLGVFQRSASSRLELPRFLRSGLPLAAMLLISLTAVVSEVSQDWSLPLMGLSFITGYGLIFWLLLRFDFSSARGFLYLMILISMTHGLILFFSFLGQISAVFFLPLGLCMIFTLLEQKSSLRRTLLVSAAFLCSNFFPGLQDLETLFDDVGHHFYTRGINGMHQNPLGWSPSELAGIRKKITHTLEKLEFPPNASSYPLLFSRLHHHTCLLFLYPQNLKHPFPSFHLLKHMDTAFLSSLREEISQNGLEVLGEERLMQRFPLLIRGIKSWSTFPRNEFSCREMIQILDNYAHGEYRDQSALFQDPFGQRLNDCYFTFLEENNLLNSAYQKIPMPADSPRIELYVNRSFPVTQNLGDYGLRQVREYQDQFQWFQKQSLLSQIIFQGVSRSRRAAEFFKKANDEMEKDSWSFAHDYLKRALELEPDHKEMLIDLAIVREKLSKHSQDSAPLNPQARLFKQANDEMEKENWSAARELLQRGLELEPDHKEMLIDLGIVEEKLGN